LHLAFGNGRGLLPGRPNFRFRQLPHPARIRLLYRLLTNLGFDLRHQLIATGLLASLATFYALYRWGGTFTVAGFLFNGGIAGYKFLNIPKFLVYQGTSHVARKSIPLRMLFTHRGLLYP